MATEWVDASYLLERYVVGRSPESFTALVKAYQQLVLNVAFSCLRDRAAAEDVTQEVFLSLIQRPPAPHTIVNERAFLVRRAIQLALSWRRGEMRRRHREQKAARREAQTRDPERAALLDQVREAIYTLPEALRLPIYLRFFEGFATEEIALALGCHRNTVSYRIRKGKKLLKRRISPAVVGFFLEGKFKPSDLPPQILPSKDLLYALEAMARKAASPPLSVNGSGLGTSTVFKTAAERLALLLLCFAVGGGSYLASGYLYDYLEAAKSPWGASGFGPADSAKVPGPNLAFRKKERRRRVQTPFVLRADSLPIRYKTGEPRLFIRGPSFGGWHFSLRYFNRVIAAGYPGVVKELVGPNWMTNLPNLRIDPGNKLVITVADRFVLGFEPGPDPETWLYTGGARSERGHVILTEVEEGPFFIYKASGDLMWYFYGSGPLKGNIFKMIGPEGEIARFYYYDNQFGRYAHRIKAVFLPQTFSLWQFFYDPATGLLQDVRAYRGSELQGEVHIDYYAFDIEEAGLKDDIKSVTVRERTGADSTSWRETRTWLRWWTKQTANGRPHDLKYLISEKNFKRLVATYEIEEIEELSDYEINGGDQEDSVRFFDCYFEYYVVPGDPKTDGMTRRIVINPDGTKYFLRTRPLPGVYEFKYAPLEAFDVQDAWLTVNLKGFDGSVARVMLDECGNVIPYEGRSGGLSGRSGTEQSGG